ALSLTINLNFPTSYYFRGIAQNNAGFQFEPYVELKANVYEGGEKDVLSGGYLKVAGFSHLQSRAAPINTNYYEQDIYLTSWWPERPPAGPTAPPPSGAVKACTWSWASIPATRW